MIPLVCGVGAFVLLRPSADPEDAALPFVAAWERGDAAAMRPYVASPPEDLVAQVDRMRSDLGIAVMSVRLGEFEIDGDTATAPFTSIVTLEGIGDWKYTGRLPMVKDNDRWKVKWSPSVLHPALKPGHRFAVATKWPRRGRILAADGSRLDTATSGSVQLLAGVVGQATAEDLKRLGFPYKPGDTVGKGGLQQSQEAHLAGRPTATIQIVDGAKRPVTSLGTIPGRPGRDVRTTLDPRIQQVAARAITRQGSPAAMVVVRPSTGDILAVVNQPGGFNRGLVGRYPPGSTFKVVTAAALLGTGLQPGDVVGCPKRANVGGRAFRNFENQQFGNIPFRVAFAKSCNTAIAIQTERRLDADRLAKTARQFGFGVPLSPGVPALRGGFPAPRDGAELAAASFGQGRVTASPLTMAGVAAAVQDGTWRPPRLVIDPSPGKQPKARALDPGVARSLRTLMSAVVTEGSAAAAGLPAGTIGKTGTAEFGNADPPETHAWFIGARDDIAFAVIVEGGEAGGKVAAPLGAAFLRGL